MSKLTPPPPVANMRSAIEILRQLPSFLSKWNIFTCWNCLLCIFFRQASKLGCLFFCHYEVWQLLFFSRCAQSRSHLTRGITVWNDGSSCFTAISKPSKPSLQATGTAPCHTRWWMIHDHSQLSNKLDLPLVLYKSAGKSTFSPAGGVCQCSPRSVKTLIFCCFTTAMFT